MSVSAQAQGPGGSNVIPEGTRFVVLLASQLQTDKLTPGKHFKAKLGEDLAAPNGVRIVRGSVLKGHVSSVDRGLYGRLLLAFDSIDTSHGVAPIAVTVVGVPGDHGLKTGKEGEIQKVGLSKMRIAEGAMAGAAAGAGTGAIASGVHGAVVGAGVGAVVGGTASTLTNHNLRLEKGQQLELELDRPFQVPVF
jgi:hypothetical protein